MKDLAVILRHAQLHNHNLHHAARGYTSKQDHEIAGEFYKELEESYDTCVELTIAAGIPIHLVSVNETAAKGMKEIVNNDDGLRYSLQLEEEIREEALSLMPTVPVALQNFLQGLSQESLHRSYHLTQRLA